MPVSILVAETFAPTMAAPLGSLTVPEIVAVTPATQRPSISTITKRIATAITASQAVDCPTDFLVMIAAADRGLAFGLCGGKELKLQVDLSSITTPSMSITIYRREIAWCNDLPA